MNSHGNAYSNTSLHHLYEIRDKTTRKAYKYGICGKVLLPNGSSGRAEKQALIFNKIAGWDRFIAVVLVADIPGRVAARKIEDEFIQKFFEENGQYPPDNLDHKKFKE